MKVLLELVILPKVHDYLKRAHKLYLEGYDFMPMMVKRRFIVKK